MLGSMLFGYDVIAGPEETSAGTGNPTGTLTATQAANTLAAVAKLKISGHLSITQGAQSVGGSGLVDPEYFASLDGQQADNTLAATAKLRIAGQLVAVQDENFLGSAPMIFGRSDGEISIGPFLSGTIYIDGFLLGDANVGPLLEGVVQ